MKQLFVKQGQIVLQDVPTPITGDNDILVDVKAAAVSIGTELSALRGGRGNPFVEVVKSTQFRQKVIQSAKQGNLWTSAKRRFKIGAPNVPPQNNLGVPTGYSCAGQVLDVGARLNGVAPGDRVACAGSPHAEITAVSKNLFVPIPSNVSDTEASFVALGSIALHSVRQAEINCGETVVVMGVGVIGQLVAQLVIAHGGRTIVSDLSEEKMELAKRLGAHMILASPDKYSIQQIMDFTDGLGADAVLLCMGGDSPKPVQQALDYLWDRGRLVVVGTPKLEIPRAVFYRKEIELRIARSYGPGRYDPHYEEDGHDYPPSYVRWTERRNMGEFLRLVSEKRIDLNSLITDCFPFEQAPQAYESLLKSNNKVLGMALVRETEAVKTSQLSLLSENFPQINLAVIGAGSFACAFHLPNAVHVSSTNLRAIVSRSEKKSRDAALRFGAEYATQNFEEVLNDPAVDLVIIATPHHLHADQTIAALEAGKAVFCEKPMGMNRDEIDQICESVERNRGFYAIGFNRRFAPTVQRARQLLSGRKGPLMINYRVMGTFLPADHWIYDPVKGGGRVVGEMCHFFDLIGFLVGKNPETLSAAGGTLSHPGTALSDNLVCTMTFNDGSVAALTYGDLGDAAFSKERLEIFSGEGVLVVDDFKTLIVHGFSRQRGIKLSQIDKGHKSELEAIAKALLEKKTSPIDVHAGRIAMNCAFSTIEALASGKTQYLNNK